MKFPEELNAQLSEQFSCNINRMLDLVVEGAEVLRAPLDESLELVKILNGNKAIMAHFKQLMNSIEMVHDAALHVLAKKNEEVKQDELQG